MTWRSPKMASVSSMFARRAAASEGSFSRDDAKAKLQKLRDRLAKEGKLPEAAKDKAVTVDVLAEVSAHSIPLGQQAAHLNDPVMHDIRVDSPTEHHGFPEPPGQAAVLNKVYSESGFSYAGRRDMANKWSAVLTETVTPSNMMVQQNQHLAAKLGRPLRESDLRVQRTQIKAQAMASASVLVGTVLCMCGAALAGAVLWRKYGKPKSTEDLRLASARVAEQQQVRSDNLKEVVGPVVSKVKITAGAAVTEHPGLVHLSEGLKQTKAIRPDPMRK